MHVFIGGMPRSGSTFSFNVVRELLERRGSVFQTPDPNIPSAIASVGSADHLIIKGHFADARSIGLLKAGNIKSICTVRKVEDAIASWMDTFGFTLERSISDMRRWIAMFAEIGTAALVIPYSSIEATPLATIEAISKHLGLADVSTGEMRAIRDGLSKSAVKAAADRLQKDNPSTVDVGHTFYDKRTFFHRRHVGTVAYHSAADRIGEEAVATIQREFADYIDADGRGQRDFCALSNAKRD